MASLAIDAARARSGADFHSKAWLLRITVKTARVRLRRMMAQLPEAQRPCLLLSVVGGFSSVEIAHMLDLGEVAVCQCLARAKKQFQRIYAQESGEAASNEMMPASKENELSLLNQSSL